MVDFLSTVAVKSICTSIVFIAARTRILYTIRVTENIIKEAEARWKIVQLPGIIEIYTLEILYIVHPVRSCTFKFPTNTV